VCVWQYTHNNIGFHSDKQLKQVISTRIQQRH